MPYFTGYYENYVDEKGRVILPKKIKEMTGTELVLTHGLGDCVFVLTREEWAALEAKISALPMSKGLLISHFFNTYKTDVTLDKQGRVQLPLALRRLAGIEGNAVITGNGSRIEIWNPERFAEMQKDLTSENIVNEMAEVNF